MARGLRFQVTELEGEVGREILRRVTDGGKLVVEVGLWSGAASDEGMPPAAYMAVHEFGSENVPERPWFRTALAAHRAKYGQMLRDSAVAIIRGDRTPQQALTRLGVEAQGDLKQSITDFGLIDTGYARNAVLWQVVDRATAEVEG